MPTTGTADYDGFLRFDAPPASGANVVYGVLEMQVDFAPAAGAVTGQVSDMVDNNELAWTGTLAITSATPVTIDRLADPSAPGGYVFYADLNGTLAGPGGSWTVDGPMTADVYTGGYLQGVSVGATVTDQSGTVTPTIFEWVAFQ